MESQMTLSKIQELATKNNLKAEINKDGSVWIYLEYRDNLYGNNNFEIEIFMSEAINMGAKKLSSVDLTQCPVPMGCFARIARRQ
jgi:hypothetical protein